MAVLLPFAHANGFSWDEALLVVAPLVLIGGLLWSANRRAARLQDGDGDVDHDWGHDHDPGDHGSADAGSAD